MHFYECEVLRKRDAGYIWHDSMSFISFFFFITCEKQESNYQQKNSQSFSKYSAELERESQFCWLSAQKKLFSVEHDTGRKFLWITFLGERKREVSTN